MLTVISSCSDDAVSVSIPEPINFEETKALIELNFIPTIENYFSKDNGTNTYRSSTLSGNWHHDFDDEGKLIKSQLFDKYPERILVELVYSAYDMDANKVSLEVKRFNYFSLTVPSLESLVLNFNKNFILKSITRKFENGPDETIVVQRMNENNLITLLNYGFMNTITGYEYDEAGNITKYSVYDANLLLKSSVDYTYTDFGNINSYHFENVGGSYSDAAYFYRNDNTLEKMEEFFDLSEEEVGNAVSIYTEYEAYRMKTINYQDGRKEVLSYNGELYTEEYFNSNQVLSKVSKYKFSETRGYYLLYEFEQYDDSGNLDYTIYYDEQGDITDTVYA